MTNIAEILKDCPKGTKLYSPICGECELLEIIHRYAFAIRVKAVKSKRIFIFSADGRFMGNGNEGECLLFPSKENRDWSTFKSAKKEPEFKPFDKVLVRDGIGSVWRLAQYGFKNKDNLVYNYNTVGGTWWKYCIPYEGNEHLLGTIENHE